MTEGKFNLYLDENEDTIVAKNCIRDTLRVVGCPFRTGLDDSGNILFFFSARHMEKIDANLRSFLVEGLKDSWHSNGFHVEEQKEVASGVYENIDYDSMLFKLKKA